MEVNNNQFRIMSFNVRRDTGNTGKNSWAQRRDLVGQLIANQQPDLIGFQEPVKHQVDDLVTMLPDYGWFGVGRDDGDTGGEFTPIFYRSDRFILLENGSFWLSQTPPVAGSKSWGAWYSRMVTFGRFHDLATGATFHMFNTHFDHASQKARIASAELIIDAMSSLKTGEPIILTADLNCTRNTRPHRILTERMLKDTRSHAVEGHHGPTWTLKRGLFPVAIDYVFVSSHNDWNISTHTAVNDSETSDASDHLPIVADVMLKIPNAIAS